MLTNCTLGGLPLLLLGNKLNRLLQGPVRLSVPEEIGHDFLISHSTYQVQGYQSTFIPLKGMKNTFIPLKKGILKGIKRYLKGILNILIFLNIKIYSSFIDYKMIMNIF